VDNLYLADSSFFVSSAAVNPTLTIIANALRVASTVAHRLGTSTRPVEAPRPRLPLTPVAAGGAS
jgi:choline dehydrogenase-like flavoprotein